MEVRDDDIWLLAHPKTGSTMMKEIMYNVAHGVRSEKPKKYHEWSCLLEMTGTQPQMVVEMLKSGDVPEEYLSQMQSMDDRYVRCTVPVCESLRC